MLWEPYNFGPAKLLFYHRDGSACTGSLEEFIQEHGTISGFKNKDTDMTVLLNSHGEIAARTPEKE